MDDGASAALEQARRLKAAGRPDEALACNRRAVELAPASGVAAHNLAATLGDLGRYGAALEWTSRAMALGTRGPETWLVHARMAQGCGDLDGAERAYEEAIRLRPDYLEAHRDLSQLVWMRHADAARACRALDARIAAGGGTADLLALKARVQDCAGDAVGAATTLDRAVARAPGLAPLRIARAHLAAEAGDADRHLAEATAALQADRGSHAAAKCAVEALLHKGQAAEAAALAERILGAVPGDQGVLALLLTAWRMLGDPRHEALCADPALVSMQTIATPPGWPDRAAFLADLAAALRARHRWKTHPLDQSLRHGSQTQEDLTRLEDPAIVALFGQLRLLIARHIAALGPGDDPVRARATGAFRLGPAWSVALRPGGFHTDHVHPQGWLSSAFYVDVPEAVNEGRQGWLSLGRPGVPTRPALEPFRALRPEPGALAIFPSCLWHGTEPFGGERPRLTVAFDILPA